MTTYYGYILLINVSRFIEDFRFIRSNVHILQLKVSIDYENEYKMNSNIGSIAGVFYKTSTKTAFFIEFFCKFIQN
jgi:hypothetical protein